MLYEPLPGSAAHILAQLGIIEPGQGNALGARTYDAENARLSLSLDDGRTVELERAMPLQSEDGYAVRIRSRAGQTISRSFIHIDRNLAVRNLYNDRTVYIDDTPEPWPAAPAPRITQEEDRLRAEQAQAELAEAELSDHLAENPDPDLSALEWSANPEPEANLEAAFEAAEPEPPATIYFHENFEPNAVAEPEPAPEAEPELAFSAQIQDTAETHLEPELLVQIEASLTPEPEAAAPIQAHSQPESLAEDVTWLSSETADFPEHLAPQEPVEPVSTSQDSPAPPAETSSPEPSTLSPEAILLAESPHKLATHKLAAQELAAQEFAAQDLAAEEPLTPEPEAASQPVVEPAPDRLTQQDDLTFEPQPEPAAVEMSTAEAAAQPEAPSLSAIQEAEPEAEPEPEPEHVELSSSPDPNYAPIIAALGPEAADFTWIAQTGTIHTYEHRETFRYIHLDAPSGLFYNQNRTPISADSALKYALTPRVPAVIPPAAASAFATPASPSELTLIELQAEPELRTRAHSNGNLRAAIKPEPATDPAAKPDNALSFDAFTRKHRQQQEMNSWRNRLAELSRALRLSRTPTLKDQDEA